MDYKCQILCLFIIIGQVPSGANASNAKDAYVSSEDLENLQNEADRLEGSKADADARLKELEQARDAACVKPKSKACKNAQAAYQKLGISPNIREWWQDAEVFRETNSWIAYTTAGYFILKLLNKYGKERLLQLAKYQTFEDACQIYGEDEILTTIREVEREITGDL